MKKKNKYITFHLFELEALAEYFEVMAKQGWMLKAIASNVFTFESCTPLQAHFHLNIYHKGSYVRTHAISEDERKYGAFLEEYGYIPVCSNSNFQVFMSTQDNVIPIHTSDDLALHKANKKTIITYEIYHYVVSALFTTSLSFVHFFLHSVELFTSNFDFLLPLFFLIFTFFTWCQCLPFLNWLVHKETYHIDYIDLLHRERNMKLEMITMLSAFLLLFPIFSDTFSYMFTLFTLFLIAFIVLYLIMDALLFHISKKIHMKSAIVISLLAALCFHFTITLAIIPTPLHNDSLANNIVTYQDVYPNDSSSSDKFFIQKELSNALFLSELCYSEEVPSLSSGETFNIFSYQYYTIASSIFEDHIVDLIIFRYQTPKLMEEHEDWKWYTDENQNQYIIKDHHVLVIQNAELDKTKLMEIMNLFEM